MREDARLPLHRNVPAVWDVPAGCRFGKVILKSFPGFAKNEKKHLHWRHVPRTFLTNRISHQITPPFYFSVHLVWYKATEFGCYKYVQYNQNSNNRCPAYGHQIDLMLACLPNQDKNRSRTSLWWHRLAHVTNLNFSRKKKLGSKLLSGYRTTEPRYLTTFLVQEQMQLHRFLCTHMQNAAVSFDTSYPNIVKACNASTRSKS